MVMALKCARGSTSSLEAVLRLIQAALCIFVICRVRGGQRSKSMFGIGFARVGCKSYFLQALNIAAEPLCASILLGYEAFCCHLKQLFGISTYARKIGVQRNQNRTFTGAGPSSYSLATHLGAQIVYLGRQDLLTSPYVNLYSVGQVGLISFLSSLLQHS